MRRLIPVLLALGAAGFGAVAPAAAQGLTVKLGVALPLSALSNPRCNGATCQGLDPFTEGCANDAQTLNQNPVVLSNGQVVAIVQLENSGACNASWAQIVTVQPLPTTPYPVANGYDPGTGALVVTETGPAINAVNTWSPMIDGNLLAEACMGVTGDGNHNACVQG
jgi:hypothetical protein